MKKYDLLVIGGVAAGMSAASQARRVDENMTIGVLEKSGYVSYGACGIPYYISNKIKKHEDLIAIDVEDYILRRKIDILRNTEAVSVDFNKKTVTARCCGKEKLFEYDKLMISTGAKPVVPNINGIKSENVFMLRNLDDGIRIKDFIKNNSPASGTLIGGGFIGLEMAESLREMGIECTILEKMESVAMTMDSDIREMITGVLKENNVKILTGVDIKDITLNNKTPEIRLDKGVTVKGDFIIASVGIIPNTAFLRVSDLKMDSRGAIIIDEQSRTNIPGVFSGGDCATVKHILTGTDVYMPLGSTANKQGRVAGLQAAGVASEIFKGITGTQFVKVFNLEVGKTGFNDFDAGQKGIKSLTKSITGKNTAGYYPGAEKILVKITIDNDSRIIIGGQTAGGAGSAQRTNVLSMAVASKMTIEDFAYMDLGYAPPFAPVWDPLLVTAQKFIKR